VYVVGIEVVRNRVSPTNQIQLKIKN